MKGFIELKGSEIRAATREHMDWVEEKLKKAQERMAPPTPPEASFFTRLFAKQSSLETEWTFALWEGKLEEMEELYAKADKFPNSIFHIPMHLV